jgi:hypothetical protein
MCQNLLEAAEYPAPIHACRCTIFSACFACGRSGQIFSMDEELFVTQVLWTRMFGFVAANFECISTCARLVNAA